MATYAPIAGISPQYEDYANYWLKLYVPTTSTPLAMYTDVTGATALAKAELSLDGFITTDGETIFIPFVTASYDAYLFPTAEDADDNNTVDAIRIADNIDPFYKLSTTLNASVVSTVEDMVDYDQWEIGGYITTTGYTTANDGGGATYLIVDAGSGVVDGGEYIDLTGSSLQAKCINLLDDSGKLLVEKFGASSDTSIDSAPRIQAAARWAHNNVDLPNSITLTSTGKTYMLKSYYPGTLPTHATGHKLGLWIEDLEKVKIDFNNGRLLVDINTPSMANIKAIIGAVQETGDQAFANITNIRTDSGQWALTAMYAEHNLKLDYNPFVYGRIVNTKCRRSVDSLLKICGFVVTMDQVDTRSSSTGSGIQAVTVSEDGNSATRTGYTLTNCTTDYTALQGISFSGSQGHTYCTFINNTVDHCGRDFDNVTIAANNATAAAYRLSGVFGATFLNCGAETSTRFARLSGCHSVSIENCYITTAGTTDGSTIDALIEIDGFCEHMAITGFQVGSSTNVSKKLKITVPATTSNVQVTKDYSIKDSETEIVLLGVDSSAPYVAQGIGSNWARGVRKAGINDARLFGYPETARQSTEWFDQTLYNPEVEFRLTTTDVVDLSVALATLTNPTNLGYVGFFVEIIVGRSLGTTAFNPKKYVASAGCAGATKTVTAVAAADTIGDAVTMTLTWVGNSLVLACTTDYIIAAVKVKAVTSPGAAKQTFRWGT